MSALDGAPDGDEAFGGVCTLSNTEVLLPLSKTEVLLPLSKTERTFSIVEGAEGAGVWG